MYDLTNLSFWFYSLLFITAVFIAFFIPGDILVRKLSFPLFQRIVIGTILGMVLWGWQGFIFGYLNLRWLSYLYLTVFCGIWLITFFKKHRSNYLIKPRIPKFEWGIILLIFIGIFIQLSAIWSNGILSSTGLYFCCGNLTDNLLHISLTNQLVNNFPPYEPGMSGIIVKNYHYWGNLVIAELIRVFNLPLIATLFQYSTLFISLFLGLSTVAFGQIANLSRRFIIWLLFFLYFGGDLIFFLVSIIRRELNFNMSSIEDGAKFLVNPPRAFSIVIFFVGISLLILWVKKKDFYTGVLTALILGSLIGFKVYTGIFALSGIVLLGLYFLIKKDFRMLIMPVVVLILSLIIYLPVNANAGGLYFTGLHIFENFIVQPWMMLERLEYARTIYAEHNNWLRVIEYELIYIFTFIITVFGTKLIGVFQSRKSFNSIPKELNILLLGGIITSAIAGFFFQQYSGGANTFNFLVSIFIIGSIYTALALDYWLSKIGNKIKLLAIILLIFFTVPRVIHETTSNINNLRKGVGFLIDNSELSALKYLREKTDINSLILVDYRGFKIDAKSPYVSFMSNRQMFLSGMEADLTTHGVDFSTRKLDVDTVLESLDPLKVAKALKQNRIDFIYLAYPYDIRLKEIDSFTKIGYKSGKITILKVLPDKINLYLRNHL